MRIHSNATFPEFTVADIRVHKRVWKSFPAFRDRGDAGLRLADFVPHRPEGQSLVLALPRGGVPVAEPIASHFQAELRLVFVRKLPIPASPEAGFGAVAIDGSRLLNERLVEHFGLSRNEIECITSEVLVEVNRRAREYGEEALPESLEEVNAYLVDDGLASGYTMVAAARMVRKLNPRSLVLCVPVSPWDSVLIVQPYFDQINALYVQERPPFAVASFYAHFPDLTDPEVKEIIARQRRITRSSTN